MAPPQACRAVVIGTRALTPAILEADVRMEEPSTLRFAAGQWISVPFGPKRVRAYSIASTPRSARVITLCADVTPAGPGSVWFRELAPGAVVTFKGPLGGFVVDRADPRVPLFVAEEIGIVPIRSMLLDLYETGFDRGSALVYWARDPSWLAYDSDFRSLGQRSAGFTYRPVVGAGERWTGERGSVAEAVDRAASTSEGLVAYVAGGATAINAARQVLMARGLERKAVKWEKFYG